MTNYSKQKTRRVDWVYSISYGDDYDKAKMVLRRLCDADERILKTPEPFIELGKLNDSSVDITMRAWVNSKDYWPVFFSMNEKVYKAFAEEELHIPFPQMDIHMKSWRPRKVKIFSVSWIFLPYFFAERDFETKKIVFLQPVRKKTSINNKG